MRECGDCMMCCKILEIEALEKPAGVWCPHADPKGARCTIYADRPKTCSLFRCAWLIDETIPEEFKPNKTKVVMVGGDGKIVGYYDSSCTDAEKILDSKFGDNLKQISKKYNVFLVEIGGKEKRYRVEKQHDNPILRRPTEHFANL